MSVGDCQVKFFNGMHYKWLKPIVALLPPTQILDKPQKESTEQIEKSKMS